MVRFVTPSVPTISHEVTANEHKLKKIQVKPFKLTKRKRQNTSIGKYFEEFSANTQMHGYKLIHESTEWERILWMTTVSLAIVVAAVLLYVQWQMSFETPTITLAESTHYSISNVYFPAVTICNMNMVSAKRAMILANDLKRPNHITPDELSHLFRNILHFHNIGLTNQTAYELLHSILQANNVSMANLTTILKPTCANMLQGCEWKSQTVRCDAVFQPINTIDGICCSFNSHATAKSNFNTKTDILRSKNPYRISAVGPNSGLMVVVRPMTDDYHSTFFSGAGVRILIHDAFDFADDNAEAKAFNPQMTGFIMVYPETTYSTRKVRQLAVEVRNCYFADERRLGYFQRYSLLNCLSECRAEMANRLCGCVPYFFPNNGSYRICEMKDMMCVRENRSAYYDILGQQSKVPATGNDGRFEMVDEDDLHFPCDCRPDCEINQYSSELTSATLNRVFSKTRMPLYKGINLTDHTSMRIFFADLVCSRYRKDVPQSQLSLLASFGGILGLLLGFSFVSVLELVYFFVIRVFIDRLKANMSSRN